MTGAFLTVSDDTGVVAGSGCQSVAAGVRCDVTGAYEVAVILGDGDDRLDAGGAALDAVRLSMAVHGGDGDDLLSAGAGDDGLDGGTGADRLQGGSGTDTVHYDQRTGVRVTLGIGSDDGDATDTGVGGRDDVAADIETVTGSPGNDQLTGSPGRDRLIGGAGADLIDGGPSQDELLGGPGIDTVLAMDGTVDLVDCGEDFDHASIDRSVDWVVGCEDTGVAPDGGGGMAPIVTSQPPDAQNDAPVRPRVFPSVRKRQDIVRAGALVKVRATAAVNVRVEVTIRLRRETIVLRSAPIALRAVRWQVVRIRLGGSTARRVRREDRGRSLRATAVISPAFADRGGFDTVRRSFLHTRH
jgi:hypothetical protein